MGTKHNIVLLKKMLADDNGMTDKALHFRVKFYSIMVSIMSTSGKVWQCRGQRTRQKVGSQPLELLGGNATCYTSTSRSLWGFHPSLVNTGVINTRSGYLTLSWRFCSDVPMPQSHTTTHSSHWNTNLIKRGKWQIFSDLKITLMFIDGTQ